MLPQWTSAGPLVVVAGVAEPAQCDLAGELLIHHTGKEEGARLSKIGATQINAGVKSVLAKHWIEISALRITTTRGMVLIRGDLRMLPGHLPQVISGVKLELMQAEIRRIPGVERVRFADET